MRNIKDQAGKYDCATSSLTDLARVADEALLNGDNTRCIAIIEDIYDLLERRAFCQMDEGVDVAASGGTRWLEPNLSPSPFCLGIPI